MKHLHHQPHLLVSIWQSIHLPAALTPTRQRVVEVEVDNLAKIRTNLKRRNDQKKYSKIILKKKNTLGYVEEWFFFMLVFSVFISPSFSLSLPLFYTKHNFIATSLIIINMVIIKVGFSYPIHPIPSFLVKPCLSSFVLYKGFPLITTFPAHFLSTRQWL